MTKKYAAYITLGLSAAILLAVTFKPIHVLAEDTSFDVYCTSGNLQVIKSGNGGQVTCTGNSGSFAVYPSTTQTGSPSHSIDFECTGPTSFNATSSGVNLLCPPTGDVPNNTIHNVTITDYNAQQATNYDLTSAQAVKTGTTQVTGAEPPAGSSSCSPSAGSFFGLKAWYAYLPTGDFQQNGTRCDINLNFVNSNGGPDQSNINSVWLIALAIFEDLLRIAGIVGIIFVIVGGIRYITSQGQPENTKKAQSTIIYALVGLAIAILAATLVGFVGTNLGVK